MLRRWAYWRYVSAEPISERARRWAATMGGYEGASDDVTVAHRNSSATIGEPEPSRPSLAGPLAAREEQLDALIAPGATRSFGGGHARARRGARRVSHLL